MARGCRGLAGGPEWQRPNRTDEAAADARVGMGTETERNSPPLSDRHETEQSQRQPGKGSYPCLNQGEKMGFESRQTKRAIKKAKQEHRPTIAERHYLTIVTRKCSCNWCARTLLVGDECVYRHTPKE